MPPSSARLREEGSTSRVRIKRPAGHAKQAKQAKQALMLTPWPWPLACVLPAVLLVLLQVSAVAANHPPRFLIDGQTEIVLRLKEGNETPVGEFSTAGGPFFLISTLIVRICRIC